MGATELAEVNQTVEKLELWTYPCLKNPAMESDLSQALKDYTGGKAEHCSVSDGTVLRADRTVTIPCAGKASSWSQLSQ